ncbi:MAG: SAF domain-containing protein [Pseudonocardiaceae bacterium]
MSTSAAPPGTERRSASPAGESWLGSGKGPDADSRLRGGPRRRSVPHLLVGALLVLATTVGFVLWSLTVGGRVPVLALARPVSVGQVLTAADLREVTIATDPGVSTMAASQASAVIGRSVATSMPAGSLLSPEVLGAAVVPGPGQAIAALALKAGAFPVELASGARVAVVLVPGSSVGSVSTVSGQGAVSVGSGVVTSVTTPVNEQITVVSVLLSEATARQVAAVPPGQLSVVMLPGGDR